MGGGDKWQPSWHSQNKKWHVRNASHHIVIKQPSSTDKQDVFIRLLSQIKHQQDLKVWLMCLCFLVSIHMFLDSVHFVIPQSIHILNVNMSSEQGVYFHTSHRCAKFVAQAPKYNTWLKCKSSTQCYKPGKSIMSYSVEPDALSLSHIWGKMCSFRRQGKKRI